MCWIKNKKMALASDIEAQQQDLKKRTSDPETSIVALMTVVKKKQPELILV
jgi:hypothetical protein